MRDDARIVTGCGHWLLSLPVGFDRSSSLGFASEAAGVRAGRKPCRDTWFMDSLRCVSFVALVARATKEAPTTTQRNEYASKGPAPARDGISTPRLATGAGDGRSGSGP